MKNKRQQTSKNTGIGKVGHNAPENSRSPGGICGTDDRDDRLLERPPLPKESDVNPRHCVEVQVEDCLAMAEPLRVPGHLHTSAYGAPHLHQILVVHNLENKQ